MLCSSFHDYFYWTKTISRSSTDDYCPQNQVEFIQDETIKVINKLHENIEVFYHYKDA